MTSVIVKRIIKIGETPAYLVQWDGGHKHFCFRENEPPESIWEEERCRREALEFAKKVESGQIVNGEEIIYQTPKK